MCTEHKLEDPVPEQSMAMLKDGREQGRQRWLLFVCKTATIAGMEGTGLYEASWKGLWKFESSPESLVVCSD